LARESLLFSLVVDEEKRITWPNAGLLLDRLLRQHPNAT
jgi:hypothetical protein